MVVAAHHHEVASFVCAHCQRLVALKRVRRAVQVLQTRRQPSHSQQARWSTAQGRSGNARIVQGCRPRLQRASALAWRLRTLHCCSVTTSSLRPTARLSSTARVAKMSSTPAPPFAALHPSSSSRRPGLPLSSRARFVLSLGRSADPGGTHCRCSSKTFWATVSRRTSLSPEGGGGGAACAPPAPPAPACPFVGGGGDGTDMLDDRRWRGTVVRAPGCCAARPPASQHRESPPPFPPRPTLHDKRCPTRTDPCAVRAPLLTRQTVRPGLPRRVRPAVRVAARPRLALRVPLCALSLQTLSRGDWRGQNGT